MSLFKYVDKIYHINVLLGNFILNQIGMILYRNYFNLKFGCPLSRFEVNYLMEAQCSKKANPFKNSFTPVLISEKDHLFEIKNVQISVYFFIVLYKNLQIAFPYQDRRLVYHLK